MAEEKTKQEENSEASEIVQVGQVSSWLSENSFDNEALEQDHLGVETIKVDAEFLIPICTALFAYGFNYLQCQGGYDLARVKSWLVSTISLRLATTLIAQRKFGLRYSCPEISLKSLQFIGFGKRLTGKSEKPTICMAFSMKGILI